MRSSMFAALACLALFACASSEESTDGAGSAVSVQPCSSEGLEQTYAQHLATLKASYSGAMTKYETAVADALEQHSGANAEAVAEYKAAIARAKSLLDAKLFIAGADIGDGQTADDRIAALNKVVNDHIVEIGPNGPIASKYNANTGDATAAYLAATESAAAAYKAETEAAAAKYTRNVGDAYKACL